MKHFFFSLLLLFSLHSLWAQQIPLGHWRQHADFREARALLQAAGKVYAITPQALLCWEADQLQVIDRQAGLSDAGLVDLAYLPALERLLLVYANGNLDVLDYGQGENYQVANIRTLLRVPFLDPSLRQAYPWAPDQLLLASAYGLLRLDMRTYDVLETAAYIGPQGSTLGVRQIAATSDSLFLLMDGGSVQAAARNANLQDFHSWKPCPALQGAERLVDWAPGLGVQRQGQLYAYRQGRLQLVAPQATALSAAGTGAVAAVVGNQLQRWTDPAQPAQGRSLQGTEQPTALSAPGSQGDWWVADLRQGLLQVDSQQTLQRSPEGLRGTHVSALAYGDQKVGAATEQGIGLYGAQGWKNFPFSGGMRHLAYSPQQRRWYAATATALYALYPDEQPAWKQEGTFQDVGALTVDAQGVLWVAVRDGVWKWDSRAFYPMLGLRPLGMVADDYGQLWIRNQGSGLWVMREGQYRILQQGAANGNLPDAEVLSMVKDQDGMLWVGTAKGVCVFTNPRQAMLASTQALLPRYQGRPLLREDRVRSLSVDPANRLWMGTDNGLWLFGSQGSRFYQHLTTVNSLLNADQVSLLQLDPLQGELWVGTAQGLQSYRTDATEPSLDFVQVKAFPNPVLAKDGQVVITGLTQDAFVKITDVYGGLIFQTRAQGGTAVWPVTTSQGLRVQPGVYLFFASDEQGEEGFVGRIWVQE